jgi:competence protein ComEA
MSPGGASIRAQPLTASSPPRHRGMREEVVVEGGIRDWLAGLSRRELVLLVALGLVGVGGAGLWYVRSLPAPVAVRTAARSPEASPTPAMLFVHVAGWVHRPGVYELGEGDRVIDAIERAGGPRRGAETSVLNLAALLTDGQQVLVPGPAPPATTGTTPGSTDGSTSVPTLVNVNSASAEELETLPGIGEVLAQAIISYREEHGPFAAVDELEEVSGIGPATLEEIRDLVTV